MTKNCDLYLLRNRTLDFLLSSLHDVPDDEAEPTESFDEQYLTTQRPTTTSTTTTTERPTNPPVTSTTILYHQQNNGYPHYQNQPLYSTSQTSQSKSLYDDKNSGYHHQVTFHNGEQANNQATSFQLFRNQGVSSTTNSPQVHQARYGTTSPPQIIQNGLSTVAPRFHGIASTIQTLLNSNSHNQPFINIFQNHGIASTTEHFTVHSNNPRETQEYHESGERTGERRPLVAVQPTNQGKVSKLSISPIPQDSGEDESEEEEVEGEDQDSIESEEKPTSSTSYHSSPTTPEPTTRSFYPTPRTSPKQDPGPTQVTRQIHFPPSSAIPQLKPQQITINLPPPDIQRIVQNPSPLLPSQSRVIVTAKASVSDESGRPLNTSELVVLALPTIPTSYDDYKEGDESFDPFYRDVPKIRRSRSPSLTKSIQAEADKAKASIRHKRAIRRLKREILEDQNAYDDEDELARDYEYPVIDDSLEDENTRSLFTESDETMDIATIKANFKKFKALLMGRRISEEMSRERKTSDEHIEGGEKLEPLDAELKIDEDEHEERKTVLNQPERVEDSVPDKDSDPKTEASYIDNAEHELPAVTTDVDNGKKIEFTPATKETEAMAESKEGTPFDVLQTDYQHGMELEVKQSDEHESLREEDKPAPSKSNSERENKPKDVESLEGAKKTSANDKLEPEEIPILKMLVPDREITDSESAQTRTESDAGKHAKLQDTINTQTLDTEKANVESDSVRNVETSDVQGSTDLTVKAKESDSKEYVKPDFSSNTEKLEPQKVLEGDEKFVPSNDEESPKTELIHEVSGDMRVKEDVGKESPLIPNDEAVADDVSESKPSGDAAKQNANKAIATENTTDEMKSKSEVEVHDLRGKSVDQEATSISNNEEKNAEEDGVKTGEVLDVERLEDMKSKEPGTKITDAVVDAEKHENLKDLIEVEFSNAKKIDKPETVHDELTSDVDVTSKDGKFEKPVDTQSLQSEVIPEPAQEVEKSVGSDDLKLQEGVVDSASTKLKNDKPETVHDELTSDVDVTSKDSDSEIPIDTQSVRSEMISEVAHEVEKSVGSDDLKPQEGAVDSASLKPEAMDELRKDIIAEKPEPLIKEGESGEKPKDLDAEKKSEKTKPKNSEEMKDSESSAEPAALKIENSSPQCPESGNGKASIDLACDDSASQSSKDVDTKASEEKNKKFPNILSHNQLTEVEDKEQLETQEEHKKSSTESTADEEHFNDSQLPESGDQEEESDLGEPSPDEILDNSSAEKSSDYPDKIQLDLLNCTPDKPEKSDYEVSGGEYDDYASAEDPPRSKESESYYEMSDEKISSQEATSEYIDSRYNSREEYPFSNEDYAPVSEEIYSTEDSRLPVSSEDYSTEGVLKFTDEIPEIKKKRLRNKNKTSTRTRTRVSSEDYVDDNYEPDHYKETSREKYDSVDSSYEKEPEVVYESSEEYRPNDEALNENFSPTTTTTTSSTTTTTTTTTTTEQPTTTTEQPTTTTEQPTTSTTTTAKPTPPSLFRPFSLRKNYKYIPPTTTPNPVVIKHRFGLLNPRPAKPIKSYNDLAPKPVIRKSPLLSRRPYGVETTTDKLTMAQRRIDDFEDTSYTWISTEDSDEDEEFRENKLTRSANDVSFNETNGLLEGDEDQDVPLIRQNSTSNDSGEGKSDSSSTTEVIGGIGVGITPSTLSTPYPLLKASTIGSLARLEVEGGNFDDTSTTRADELTTETVKLTELLQPSESPTSSSSRTIETTEKEPFKAEMDLEEEVPKVAAATFSCIDREPYRFYGDPRDCRLFHYCSPGFTFKQMLDFRFVCEDSTMFDEESQSCRLDIENPKCINRQW